MIDVRSGVFQNPPIEIGGYKMLDVIRASVLIFGRLSVKKTLFIQHFFNFFIKIAFK
jgi:hypothetical protein